MAAISFEFITDLRRFLPGVRKVSGGLEDVQADLKETVTQADKLDRELSGAFDDARRSASKLGTSIKTDIGDATSRVGGTAKQGMSEVGGELAENLSEGFQSGDFVGVATETASSLTQGLAGLGPLGVAGGVGAGVVALIAGNMKKRADEIKAVGVAFGETLASAMQQGIKASDIREATVEALKTSLEDIGVTMGDFAALTEAAGINWDYLNSVLATGGPELDAIKQALQEASEETETYTGANGAAISKQTAAAEQAEKLLDTINRVSDATRMGAESAIAEADAIDGARKNSADYRRELEKVRDQMRRTASSGALVEWLNENSRAARRARREIEDLFDAMTKTVEIGSQPIDWFGGNQRRGTPRAHMSDGRR